VLISLDIAYWKASSVQLTYQSAYTSWIIGGSGIHIYGGGTFNGSGDTWYNAGTTGPIPWTIYNAKNVLVEDIFMVQSPFWHNLVYQSSNVTFNNINIHSIQTDGTQAQNTGRSIRLLLVVAKLMMYRWLGYLPQHVSR
jgi:polygalacturonase